MQQFYRICFIQLSYTVSEGRGGIRSYKKKNLSPLNKKSRKQINQEIEVIAKKNNRNKGKITKKQVLMSQETVESISS